MIHANKELFPCLGAPLKSHSRHRVRFCLSYSCFTTLWGVLSEFLYCRLRSAFPSHIPNRRLSGH